MINIVDDYLDEKDWKALHTLMCGRAEDGHSLPWYMNTSVAFLEGDEDPSHFYFSHMFYWECEYKSQHVDYIMPILEKMKPRALIRIKANLYPNTHKVIEHAKHKDMTFENNGALYMVNSCDGFTNFNGEKVESVANRMVFFDPQEWHNSSTTSNTQSRVTINFNYL